MMGFDNLPMSKVIGLTTMEQHIDVKISYCVDYLIKSIAGENPSQEELMVTPTIVERETTIRQ